MARRGFRRDLALVTVALASVTAWIDLGAIHRFQNADSLVMSLISLQRWTPLFWEQNRLGMLIPLLALPFRHPLTNLLVQSGLTIFSGLAGMFLLGYFVAGRRRGMIVGALAGLLLVVGLRHRQQFDYLVYVHQYPTSLTLSLLALLLLARWQRGAASTPRAEGAFQAGRLLARWLQPSTAVLLIWLALWVNPSLAFALGPLVLLRRFLLGDVGAECDESADRDTSKASNLGPPASSLLSYPVCDWVALSATASGLVLSMLLSRYGTPFQDSYAFLPPGEWLACALALLRNMPDCVSRTWMVAVFLTGLSGLATLAWPRGKNEFRRSACMALGLLLPAAVQFAFVSSIDHVHRTDYSRYVLTSIFLVQAACLLFAVCQWLAVLPDSGHVRRASYVLLAIFCVAAAARHGLPGLERVRAGLQEAAGKYSEELLAERCTHVVGDYYHVWPAVYHCNLLLAERGDPYTVWGIAQRSQPTVDLWTRVPLAETRIGELRGDEQHSRRALAAYGIEPFIIEQEGQSIRVLRPVAPLAEIPAVKMRR